MILIPALFLTALLLLAGVGCYMLISGLFSPWHILLFPLTVLAILAVGALIFHLCWIGIDRWRRPPA